MGLGSLVLPKIFASDMMLPYVVALVRNPTAWLSLALLIAFVTIAVFTWRAYVRPAVNPEYVPNCEFNGACRAPESTDVTLIYFYTTWCPHCKTARPEWERLREWSIGRHVGGKTITMLEVDCDADKATAAQYNVDSYPTVKLVKGDTVVDYDAKPSFETLRRFLEAEL